MPKQLTFSLNWNVPQKVIYNALQDQMEIMKFTRSKALVEGKVDGKFSLFEGKIHGVFKELDGENFKIVQDWQFNDWNSASEVVITFKETDEDECEMTIVQTKIPDNVDTEKLQQGWMEQIFKPMSMICGFGLEN